MKKIDQLAIDYSRETFINPALTYKRELCVKGFTDGIQYVINELTKLGISKEELLEIDSIINQEVNNIEEQSTFKTDPSDE